MAYTALEKMRRINKAKYGCNVGPMQPELHLSEENEFDLKSCALRFIHERCEGLQFNRKIEEEEDRTGVLQGTSAAPGQIPYNMQMDINRLCLERELEQFLESGSTQDAYNVYYCYLEIFLGSYAKSKQMIELLSEYEINGSSLLIKHRDHYSHSVYVFALGLAIYESNENYRRAFNKFYNFDSDGDDATRDDSGKDDTNKDDAKQSHDAATFFLAYWGLTSLFHDIGYPFELPFEQVLSYFELEDEKRGDETPFLAYKNIHVMTDFGNQAKSRFEELYGRKFKTVDELLAFDITQKLGEMYGFSEDYMLNVLRNKAVAPENSGYHMDHGYFSALRLYQGLTEAMGIDSDKRSHAWTDDLMTAHVDALSAIVLHNLVFKYSVSFYKTGEKPPLPMDLHPLAWLLMLCDELQCWDRTAYGRNSRTQLQPMGAGFNFRNNRLVVGYLFDEEEQDKIDNYLEQYVAWKASGKQGKEPRLKAYSDIANEKHTFSNKIKSLVDTSGMPLIVLCNIAPVNRGSKQIYLSNSNFLHLHDFAVALNGRYTHEGEEKFVDQETLEEEFARLSLEYKLSNINQAKNFGRYLDAINCFYSDRSVDYDVLKEFTPEQINILGPMEYERWVVYHRAMGWIHGDIYEHAPVPEGMDERAYHEMLREQMRCHRLAMDNKELTSEQIREHYDELSDYDKDKERLPFNSMLQLVRKFDGLRIYQFSNEKEDKKLAGKY